MGDVLRLGFRNTYLFIFLGVEQLTPIDVHDSPNMHTSTLPADLCSSPHSSGATQGKRAAAAGDSHCWVGCLFVPSPYYLSQPYAAPRRDRGMKSTLLPCPPAPRRAFPPPKIGSRGGRTSAEAAAGPWGLGGMCRDCSSREKHLRVPYKCFCLFMFGYRSLQLFGKDRFPPLELKNATFARQKWLAFTGCYLA